jgi:hypothetical protein
MKSDLYQLHLEILRHLFGIVKAYQRWLHGQPGVVSSNNISTRPDAPAALRQTPRPDAPVD